MKTSGLTIPEAQRAAVNEEIVRQEAERAKRGLRYYTRLAWHLVEPAVPFIDNWHIGLLSEYLEAVTALQIQNLIINIPPRHMKSLMVCVFWPTWVWTKSPGSRWLTASYALNYAVRDAVKSRRIIQSAWYQERFGSVFHLAGDQNVKSRYENDKGGHRISVGVESGSTGEGGDYIVVDDPTKAQDKDSAVALENAKEWWDGTMSTRGNNPKTVRRVIIMQRLSDNDLTGHVLEKAKEIPEAPQFEHLVLPARYEPKRFVSAIGLEDPRKQDGELLWPERFDEASLAGIEATLGTRDAAGQLQQRPAPAGGNIFLREWWERKNRYDATDQQVFNRNVARWLSWDTAFKDKEQNDTTALGVWELTPDYRLMLRYAWWARLQFPQLASAIEQEAVRWNYDEKLRGIIVEDKGSGISALQTLSQGSQEAISRLLIAFQPGQTSKPARARQASLWCDRNCILLPEPSIAVPWLFDFEELLFKFPGAKIDDPVDAFDQGILYCENLIAQGWQLRTSRGVS